MMSSQQEFPPIKEEIHSVHQFNDEDLPKEQPAEKKQEKSRAVGGLSDKITRLLLDTSEQSGE